MTSQAMNHNHPLYIVRPNPDRRQGRHTFLVSERRYPEQWVAKMPSRKVAEAYASRMSTGWRGWWI